MVGTIINAVTIIFCSIIGLLFKKALPQRLCETITQGMGLGIMIIGISMALKTQDIIILLVSLLFGAVIGELLNIEKQLKRLGDRLGSKMKKKDNTISQGFVTASLLFCTGSMGIMGAIENGLTGTYGILLSKSLLDGIFSIIFASTMGIGVLFSAIPVFLYQGGITLLAGSIKTLLSAGMINEMNAVGGVLIFAIGINMVKIKNLKIGNLLPAIIMPIIILWVLGLFGF
ncbi:DUF554 domain-containing protein [Acetobacterium sp.]|uniref:DUF554 domain-containing protein n=1 Tax=Acetobacterium sp. TaxID=1872094 RepID=UPI002F411DB0